MQDHDLNELLSFERLQIEVQKFMAETRKLNAERAKLEAETRKLTREYDWFPFAAGAGFVTALVAVITGLVKFLL